MKILSSKLKQKKSFENFIAQLEEHRKLNNYLVICPEPTEYSWLGVQVATKSLFSNSYITIPQYYSNSLFSEKQLVLIADKIKTLKYEQIILSGFPPYFELFVKELHQYLNIKVIYHGFFAELSSNDILINSFKTIINFARQNKISTLAFVKSGMTKTISSLFHIKCVDLVLPCFISGTHRTKPKNEIQIGCLVNNSFRKNLHNQITAALMLKNSNVHVFENKDLYYLPQERIVQHKLMEHSDFINLLGSMDINLHITYSESWGQVLAESIALGVPCLSAYTSAYFDYNDFLKEALIVDGFDDSWNIQNKIISVINNYEQISNECIKYSKELNNIAKNKTHIFIESNK